MNITKNYRYEAVVIIMCLIYAVIAFVNLGDTASPQVGYEMTAKESIVLDLGAEAQVHRISVFCGAKPVDKGVFAEISSDGEAFEYAAEIKELSVFAWHTADIDAQARYIRLADGGSAAEIKEVALFDEGGRRISYSTGVPEICDEQDLAAYRATYKNGTYFDEIYHARTAWEYTHATEAYEWTHPPLGKLIMSVGIQMFGMTPFGWRFTGTVLGIIMIWIMYLLAYEIFGSKKAGLAAAFLMMFDFMHFTQTRIATIDTYAVFFIMLMYLFIVRFSKTDYNREGTGNALKNLFWCGFFFGLGVASKWTCIYAGAGLVVIFLIKMLRCLRERNEDYLKNTMKIVLSCIVFFIIIPVLIYWVSYLPYAYVEGNPRTVFDIFEIQKDMFYYHSDLTEGHFFGSKWYQWPVMYRPIWYFSGGIPEENIVSSISAFGNPAVWWTSVAATALMLFFAVKERDFSAPVLVLTGYLSQYLPWVGVTRVTFIYHYFTSVPFIILIIIYSAKRMKAYISPQAFGKWAAAYAAVVVILFVMFYPVISGLEVPKGYIGNVLTWFDTWYFGG